MAGTAKADLPTADATAPPAPQPPPPPPPPASPAPAAPAQPAGTGRLPLPLDSFVGRGADLVELESLLADHRLVTLTGPGGAGKTRLAVEFAHRTRARWTDGVWLAELASLTDGALIAQTVADCLDIREEAVRPLPDTLADAVGGSGPLLVLDNCEHVVLVERLLSRCPRLRVLATSREALELPGEAVHRVGELSLSEGPAPVRNTRTTIRGATAGAARTTTRTTTRSTGPDQEGSGIPSTGPAPGASTAGTPAGPGTAKRATAKSGTAASRAAASGTGHARRPGSPHPAAPPGAPGPPGTARVPDAVRLFVERARSCAPDFTLTEANAARVAAICRRLDGMPLAIELAARRVRLLPVEEIHDRLDDRFRLLKGGARTADARHRDLRTTIEWSHDLLERVEQAVFRRLSALVGGFSVATATAVCADGRDVLADDVFDLLSGLEARSLIVPERGTPAGRFRQLETIRLYGRERLDLAGEADAAFGRLADHLIALAEPIVGDEMLHCYQEFEPLDTERANLGAAVEWAAARGDARYVPLAAAMGRCRRHHGHATEGRALLAAALAAGGPGHPGRGAALEQAAALAAAQGDRTEAMALASEARLLAERAAERDGRPVPLVRALSTLALVHLSGGRPDKARITAEHTLDLVEPLGRPLDTSVCMHNLAWFALQSGDPARAGELMERCMPLYRRHSPHPLPPEWSHTAAVLALACGDAQAAEAHLREGLTTYLPRATASGDGLWALPITGVVTLEGLALAAAGRGRAERALRLGAFTTVLRTSRRLRSYEISDGELRDTLARARTALPAGTVERAEREGGRLGLAEALEYALHDVWPEPAEPPSSPLTDRERQVVELVADGLTNRQIATRLYISARTVESHLESIRTRLGLRSRAQLAAWAARHPGAGPGPAPGSRTTAGTRPGQRSGAAPDSRAGGGDPAFVQGQPQ